MQTTTTTWTGRLGTWTLAAAVAAVVAAGAPAPAFAQDDPNPGALSFTGGFDVPTLYFFRGIRQEADEGLTMWPFGDLGIALYSGDGGLKSAGVNIGVWNSLHTGSSGSDGISGKLHYEEDFYATLSLGFGGGVTLGTTYMALTSPNNMFATVKEMQFKVNVAHMLAPYGFLAFELSDDGQADAGLGKGTYFELGVGPSWPLGEIATLAVPVKLGLSLNDYYEGFDDDGNYGDQKFGFFDVGGLVTFPLTGIPSRFGAWNFHAGANLLVFGNTTEAANLGDGSQVVGLFGFGVSY